ncbi:Chorismate synthase [hydrothermal vent metagenome]|uniref:chorismate synthase n=1 Tax=hydrothermal vent metagenome TaxID=652676 RepID=A0A3B0UVY5_9ZZZZ
MEILGGPLFGVAGAGESHGPGITTIVFGCPPGLALNRSQIQAFLDRRRPGGNRHGTPRNEKDKVLLLSGLYQDDHDALTAGPAIEASVDGTAFSTTSYEAGFTTGEPISAVVLSASTKSRHYDQFAGLTGAVRPGHTDLVKYHKAKGRVDIRGSGRSSYRSTISDVIGGSIARIFLQETFGTVFLSSISQVGSLTAQHNLNDHFTTLLREGTVSPAAIEQVQQQLAHAKIHSLDADFAGKAAVLIKQTRIAGDSIGAAVEVVAVNVPALAGDPLYQSLKLRLMGSLGGLHAAQSCEIGDGFRVVSRRGSENNDPIRHSGYQGNSHGGLIGGVTTGMPLVCRVGFKPTSTIVKSQQSVQKNLAEVDFLLDKGRHDPCVGVRAGITLESRMAIELMNAVLMHQARFVDPEQFKLFRAFSKP